MLDKLKNIFEAQKKMTEIKKGLETINVDYEVAGGQIKVVMSGTQRIISFDINEQYLKNSDKPVIEKDMVKCINGASEKVQKIAADQLKSSMGDLKIPGL